MLKLFHKRVARSFTAGLACGIAAGFAITSPTSLYSESAVPQPASHPLSAANREKLGLVQRVTELEKLLKAMIECDENLGNITFRSIQTPKVVIVDAATKEPIENMVWDSGKLVVAKQLEVHGVGNIHSSVIIDCPENTNSRVRMYSVPQSPNNGTAHLVTLAAGAGEANLIFHGEKADARGVDRIRVVSPYQSRPGAIIEVTDPAGIMQSKLGPL